MKREAYLFDTHALLFWNNKAGVSDEFIRFFDRQDQLGTLHVSSVSFWEIGLLVRKARLEIADVHAWKNELLANTQVRLIDPSAAEMIDSTLLPDHHNDPFDRMLIAQAKYHNMSFVSKDLNVEKYGVPIFWI